MADVFLSYSREDRARAEQVAQGLAAVGVEVFWDNEVPPGQTWADYIEGKLAQCKAQIVLWSESSTKSQWVREEARMGRDKGVLKLRLLTTIAASLGTALENARLFDETQRLLKITEERNAELAIINSVQAALAAELNIQGIYDAVGDKIREIFSKANVGIRIYDPKTNMIHFPYYCENGERISVDSFLLQEVGFGSHVIRTRQTLLVNENMEEEMAKYGSFNLPGTGMSKSVLFVPMGVGDQARGLINLVDNEHEHAFSESDVRLLQTLANRMSVDDQTGELRKAWVFTLVLAWSRHQYAEIVFDQKLPTWLRCHQRAFEFFGGVPQRIVLDNLKAAIIKAYTRDDDPTVQQAYRECAEHYGFLIDPCLPRRPQHKGKVERGGVGYLQQAFVPLLPDGATLSEANRQLRAWLLTTTNFHQLCPEPRWLRAVPGRLALTCCTMSRLCSSMISTTSSSRSG